MSIFDIFKSKTPAPAGRLDETLGHAATRKIDAAAQKGDWQRARDILSSESDHVLRSRYISVLSDAVRGDSFIPEWLAAEPKSADALLLAGDRAVAAGFAIRGEQKADAVSDDAWDPFHEKMNEAREFYFRAAEASPNDPLPWSRLLMPAMTLGDAIEDRLTLIGEAVRRDRTYHGSALAGVAALTQKWGGSHELMFDFARDVAETPPDGSAVAAAVPFAHAERWLYIVHWENNPKAADAYFKRPSVREEIRASQQKCEDAPDSTLPGLSNIYSFCYYLGGLKKEAKKEFAKANGVFAGVPWQYLGEQAYQNAIKDCW